MAVSNTQLGYVERATLALQARAFEEVVRLIRHVISDSAISEGKEDLDERWEGIWNGVERYAPRYAPSQVMEQISEAIANIQRTDKNLWELRLSEEQPITILLGAGASKPPPSNIPVVGEFLPELWRRARKLDREDLNKLASWCDDNNISNIEDLLTAAQIADFSTKSRGILALLHRFLYSGRDQESTSRIGRERFYGRSIIPQSSDVSAVALLQDTLQILFSLLAEPMISAEPNNGHKAIANLISKHANATIITTNYDGCIDQELEEVGIPHEYLIEQPGYRESNGIAKLIKMHGSINWFYCESCQEMKIYGLKFIKETYDKETLSYPVMGICKNCGGLSRPMIVPPLSLKFFMFPPLAGLWDRAQKAFQEARIILVVGYSFSEADTYITKMISRAIAADPHKQLIVVDIDRSLAANVAEKLVAHIDNFERKRVIRAVESCDVLLPQLCKSLLGEEVPVLSKKSRK